MAGHVQAILKKRQKEMVRNDEIKIRKHLNGDALIKTMRAGFNRIHDHRSGHVTHTLADSLMAGFAMFSLKDPSLLAFDERRFTGPHNLMTIYAMGSIPCDTSIREILDGVDPNDLRPLFKDAFRQLQRGKVLEKYLFMGTGYLLNIDGTGYFSSDSRHSDACMEKKSNSRGDCVTT